MLYKRTTRNNLYLQAYYKNDFYPVQGLSEHDKIFLYDNKDKNVKKKNENRFIPKITIREKTPLSQQQSWKIDIESGMTDHASSKLQ